MFLGGSSKSLLRRFRGRRDLWCDQSQSANRPKASSNALLARSSRSASASPFNRDSSRGDSNVRVTFDGDVGTGSESVNNFLADVFRVVVCMALPPFLKTSEIGSREVPLPSADEMQKTGDFGPVSTRFRNKEQKFSPGLTGDRQASACWYIASRMLFTPERDGYFLLHNCKRKNNLRKIRKNIGVTNPDSQTFRIQSFRENPFSSVYSILHSKGSQT